MTAPAFGNPVHGIIAAEGQVRASGQFEVTRSFAEHQIISPGALGVDIGNARCGDPVLTMLAGTVIEIFRGVPGSTVPAGASIFRLDHGGGWSSGYGHAVLDPGLKMQMHLPEGFQFGTISQIGATACHLHFDTSLNGVRLDSMPLLRQNQPALPLPPPPPTYPRTLFFAKGTYIGRKFSATGAITASKSYTLTKASSAPASRRSAIAGHPGFWFLITAGVWAGYWIPEGPGIS